MSAQIVLFLVVDGIVSGAIYALLALAVVLVYSTTRVIFVPQGEFVAFGALSLAYLRLGLVPGSVYLVALLAIVASAMDVLLLLRQRRASHLPSALLVDAILPAAIVALTLWLGPRKPSLFVAVPLAILLVAVMGPLVYRIAFQPLHRFSTRVLFVAAIAVHFVLEGAGLLAFTPEGYRIDPFLDTRLVLDGVPIKGQALVVIAAAVLVMAALNLFFTRTLPGKALRAAASNRLGSQLVGISPVAAGRLAFAGAALIAAISGVLIIGLTTIYYDSGFLISLKAFVAAICGGMASYPVAIFAALAVGIFESFSAFWASAYKDAIVFALLIPFLLWLNLRSLGRDQENEE